jgi:hypothetical protein
MSALRSSSRFGFAGVSIALNLEVYLLRLHKAAVVLASWRRCVLRQSKECPFSTALGLLCAWACCVVSKSEEKPDPPFSAALGLNAALGFLVRVGLLCAS